MPKSIQAILIWIIISVATGFLTAFIWIVTFKSLFDSGGIILVTEDNSSRNLALGMSLSFLMGGFFSYLTGIMLERLSSLPTDFRQFRLLLLFGLVGAQLGILLRGVAAAKFEVTSQLVLSQNPMIFTDKLNLPVWALAGFVSGLALAIGISMAIVMMKVEPKNP